MNINFFKKNTNQDGGASYAKQKELPTKPGSETGPRPIFLWKLLLVACLFLGLLVFIFIIFSYRFLTQDRVGVVENSPSSNPKINVGKIEKINSFFEERSKAIQSAYQKNIFDPGLN